MKPKIGIEHIYKQTRKNARLTQQEVALKLGRSQSYISKIEKGELRPDVYEWFDFCFIFKIKPGSFLGSRKCLLLHRKNKKVK